MPTKARLPPDALALVMGSVPGEWQLAREIAAGARCGISMSGAEAAAAVRRYGLWDIRRGGSAQGYMARYRLNSRGLVERVRCAVHAD